MLLNVFKEQRVDNGHPTTLRLNASCVRLLRHPIPENISMSNAIFKQEVLAVSGSMILTSHRVSQKS